VIGHLPAAVDLHDGNVARVLEVLAAGVQPEGEHRRVFQQPYLVARRRIALVGEALHRAPRGLVRGQPEMANQGRIASRGVASRGIAQLRIAH
jgi:hypothetical protein